MQFTRAFVERSRIVRIGLALACSALGRSALAGTYYVSPSGSDGALGTSPGSAWKTLQHAADAVGAGDTVIALAGHYKGFYLSSSGSPGAPITFTANPGQDQPNPLVVVDANNSTTPDRINLEGASWVTIEGFTVQGSGDPATNRTGIRSVLASHVTLRANRIDLCGRWGILTGFVDDLLIELNEASRSVVEHGIYVSNSGDRPIVRQNRIWGNHSNGLHMNGDLSEGGDGIISQALVERNVIYENGNGSPLYGPPGGSAINCDGVQGSLIQNNLLYANHKSGISLYQIDGGGPSIDNTVVCNTVHNAVDSRFALNIKNGSYGNRVYDNVLLDDHPTHGSIDIESDCLPGFVCDYNALEQSFSLDGNFLSFAQWKTTTGQDAHSFLTLPTALWANFGAGDYHLLPGAPAVDAGTSLYAPALDIEGKHRPALAGFDLGAHEYGACLGELSSYGAGLAGSGGFFPALGGTGCPDQGATLSLSVSKGLGGALGILLIGASPLSTPLYGGTLLASPDVLLPHALAGASGSAGAGAASFAFSVPIDATLAATLLYAQSGYLDPAAAAGVSLSAGLQIHLE